MLYVCPSLSDKQERNISLQNELTKHDFNQIKISQLSGAYFKSDTLYLTLQMSPEILGQCVI